MPRRTPPTAVERPHTIRDIARIMQCSADTVRRHHEAWTRDAGFPSPVSLAGVRGLRWSAQAVMAWQLQRASGASGQAATDWSAVAAARGALLDAGIDPDAPHMRVAFNNQSMPTLPLSD